jgi:biotin carboxyl carrier protein
MDLKLLQRLIRIMKRGELTELEIDEKETGVHLRLRRGGDAPPPPMHVVRRPRPADLPRRHPPPGSARRGRREAAGHPITSPMVGTFYFLRAGRRAVRQVGARIKRSLSASSRR